MQINRTGTFGVNYYLTLEHCSRNHHLTAASITQE